MNVRKIQVQTIVVDKPTIDFFDVISTILRVQHQVVERRITTLMQTRVQFRRTCKPKGARQFGKQPFGLINLIAILTATSSNRKMSCV